MVQPALCHFVYQWNKNGVDIAGANGAQYGTPSTTLEDDQSLFSVLVRQ
jgi:hypothetical protein